MKNYFILAGIFMSLMYHVTFSQKNYKIKDSFGTNSTSASVSSGLVITYPIDRMITQRNSANQATISISGQFSDFSTSISQALTSDYQIWRMPLKENDPINPPSIQKNWTNITSNHLGGGEYLFLINETLPTGWYRLEVRLRKISNNQVVARKRTMFGIGDVYFIAGQSNASGFLWGNNSNEDSGLQAFNANYEQMDAVSVYSELQFTSESKINGLPNNKQFSKLLPGNSENAQPIYPHGLHSWCWGPLGSRIVKDAQVPVEFFNVARPQSSSSIWTNINGGPGDWLSQKFRSTLQMYGSILGTRGVLWHQGENDAIDQTFSSKTNFCDYSTNLSSIIGNSRTSLLGSSSNKNLTWFVSQASYYSYPFNANNQTCSNYCTYNTRLTTDLSIPPYGTTGCAVTGLSGNICSASSPSSTYNPSLVNSQFSLISTTENIKAGIFTDNILNRGNCQKIHFTGDALLDVANRWYDKLYPNNQPSSTTPIEGSLLAPISVTDNGSSFRLSLPFVSGRKYFWVKNDEGIYDTTPSNNFFDVSKANINTTYICYFSDDTDADVAGGWNLRLRASQPFRIPSFSKSLSWSQSSLAFGSGTESKNVNVNSSNVIWSISNSSSWITSISTLNGGDGTTNIIIQTSPNTSSSIRQVNLNLQEDGGGLSQTITITQAANSTCTQTNLSSLTPINPSSERQGYGTMQNNLNISGQTLMVGGYQTTNGIGTHANSRIVYNLGGQYNTFTGSVGRDDAADNCNCGIMKTQFVVKADGVTLFTSNLLGTADGKQDFSLSVSGRSQLELIVNDGGDNIYGDHADWLDAILYCGSAPTCTSPPPPLNPVTSSPSTINSGSSSTLSATCSTGTVLWSTGATGNTLVVSPTITTTYNAKCISGTCPESTAVPVSVTVNSSGCSGISDNLEMGTWTVTNDKLVARFFHGQYWLTQRAGTNPEVFVVRGSAMLQRSDVNLTNSSYYNMINCFGWIYCPYGNLGNPSVSTFPTPSGFSLSYLSDGTMVYTANTGGGGGGSCSDTYVSNNWASATIGDGTPKIGFDYQGGTMTINGTNYTQGIGTHAGSEIVYNLGNHSYANFKASVGRDQSAYGCNCGGQTIVFKVYNHTTGALIGGPVTKGINQSASDMVVPIAGVSSIRLVVEDGGDQIWGDWANWANARFTCPNSSLRKSALAEEEWFWISPNPNDGKFIAKVKLKASQKVVLYLTNTQGKAIKEYSFEGKEGENNFEIQIPNVQDQVYNLRCQAGEESSSKRIVIQK